jgi:FKBP-type peptidyl-prolyl cis-trans isomerase 2
MKVHSIGQLTDDGRVFEDTKEANEEKPPYFYLGNHEVIKCLEIAYA